MENTKGVHDGHRDRMREKYLKHGLSVFESHEVLEFALYYCIPRRDVNELAHTILNYFGGSLDRVFSASVEELTQIDGVSRNTAVLLKLFHDSAVRVAIERSENMKFLNTWSEIGEYMKPFFEDADHEIVVVLALDGKRKILFCRRMFEGGFSKTTFDMRQLLQTLTLNKAIYAVIAHNHPSGLALPSAEDSNMTLELAQTLRQFNIILVDHLIYADHDYISFAQSGFLPKSLQFSNLFADPFVHTTD